MDCEEADCERTATIALYIPWDDDRRVCAPHARILSRQDGVVADPMETAADELPDGASNRSGE